MDGFWKDAFTLGKLVIHSRFSGKLKFKTAQCILSPASVKADHLVLDLSQPPAPL
jgi:hypothetical protein